MRYLLIFCILMTGCTRTVLIPVSSCEAPPAFEPPALMVDSLTPTATTQDKLQALKVDYGTMRQSLQRCTVLLDAYRNKPAKVEPKN